MLHEIVNALNIFSFTIKIFWVFILIMEWEVGEEGWEVGEEEWEVGEEGWDCSEQERREDREVINALINICTYWVGINPYKGGNMHKKLSSLF